MLIIGNRLYQITHKILHYDHLYMVVKFQRQHISNGPRNVAINVVNNGERSFALTRGLINEREEVLRC